MANSSVIVTLLTADTTLMAILTGGIYDVETSGRLGIHFKNPDTSSAFDATTGQLKPCAMVRSRDQIPSKDIKDAKEQVTSYDQIMQIWIYQEAGGVAEIENAKNRILKLIQQKIIDYGFFDLTATDEGRQAEDMNGASFIRLDFMKTGILQPT